MNQQRSRPKRTWTTSPSNLIGGIRLVPDTDEPGLNAAAKNGEMLADLFRWWGLRKYSSPDSYAIARYQRELDDMAQLIQAREAAGLDTSRYEWDREVLFQHMWNMWKRETRDDFANCETVEEYEMLLRSQAINIDPNKIDYAAIKAQVDIVEYISKHAELRQRGNSFSGMCPLPDHEDSTPSFHVYPETRSWYCYGCNRGGDIFDYAKLRGQPIA